MILTKPWFVLLSLSFTKRCNANLILLQFVPNVIVTPPRVYRSALADGRGTGVKRDASERIMHLLAVRGGGANGKRFFGVGSKSKQADDENKKQSHQLNLPPFVEAMVYIYSTVFVVSFIFDLIYILIEYKTEGILKVPGDILCLSFNYKSFLACLLIALFYDSLTQNISSSVEPAPRSNTLLADVGEYFSYGSVGNNGGDADGGCGNWDSVCEVGDCGDAGGCDG